MTELETFVAVARSGSISNAATRLGVAKSVVSRRLSELEARLSTPLVLRTTRRMSLTDAGETLLVRAEAILSELDAAEAAVAGGHAQLEGRLRIAAPLSFGLSVLEPLVARFAAGHPSVLMEVDLSDRNVDLVEEGFDLALRIGVLTDSSLVARTIAPIGKAVAAAPSFWERYGTPETPSDLNALPCLYYSRAGKPGPLKYWGPKGRAGELTPPPRLITTSGDFMARAAAEGLGFVVAPRFILTPWLERAELITVLCDHAWSDFHLHLVYPPTHRPTARAKAFGDAVIAYIKNEAAGAI